MSILLSIGSEQIHFDPEEFLATPGNQPQLEEKLAQCARWSATLSEATAQKRSDLERAKLDLAEFEAKKHEICREEVIQRQGTKEPTVGAIKNRMMVVFGKEYRKFQEDISN